MLGREHACALVLGFQVSMDSFCLLLFCFLLVVAELTKDGLFSVGEMECMVSTVPRPLPLCRRSASGSRLQCPLWAVFRLTL